MSERTIKDTVLTFIINLDSEVLLYRRINTWYQPNKLALVGGLVDKGETLEEAAVREIYEETTLKVETKDLLPITITEDLHDNTIYRNHYFLTKVWSGTPSNNEPDRCSELSWHKIDNLPDDTIPIIKIIINEYVPTR